MLTFTPLKGSGIKIAGGAKPVAVFPDELLKDAINLVPAPEETPDQSRLSWPGEYDVAGITVRGIGHQEGQRVSYVFTIDDTRIAAPCSPIEEWHEHEIELLGSVDVLILPAEDPKKAQMLIDEVDPRAIILVPGSDGKMDQDVVKLCGAVGKEQVSEYKLKGLPAEGREVVVLA